MEKKTIRRDGKLKIILKTRGASRFNRESAQMTRAEEKNTSVRTHEQEKNVFSYVATIIIRLLDVRI